MSRTNRLVIPRSSRLSAFVLAALCGALGLGVVSGERLAAEAAIIGRVVEVKGAVFAEAPGEPRRALQCGDPILDGDRILSEEHSQIGFDLSGLYAGLGSNSEVKVAAAAERDGGGAPHLDLAGGQLRVIDSGIGAPGDPEITTPALRLAAGGGDVEALVFAGKAGTISMVCGFDTPVDVAALGSPEKHLEAPVGSCVVAKPREALYIAPATHPKLAVLGDPGCGLLAAEPVSGRFTPASVAFGGSGLGPPVGPTLAPALGDPFEPCTTGPSCQLAGGEEPPTQQPTVFPFLPPVLPLPALPAVED